MTNPDPLNALVLNVEVVITSTPDDVAKQLCELSLRLGVGVSCEANGRPMTAFVHSDWRDVLNAWYRMARKVAP